MAPQLPGKESHGHCTVRVVLEDYLSCLVNPFHVDVDFPPSPPAHPVGFINLNSADGVKKPGAAAAMPVDNMQVLEFFALPLPKQRPSGFC